MSDTLVIPTNWQMYDELGDCPSCHGEYERTDPETGKSRYGCGADGCVFGEITIATPGDDYVAGAMARFAERVRNNGGHRRGIPEALAAVVKDIAAVYPEVHDTEPEWAIVDFVNVLMTEQQWGHISRDDLSTWDD